MSESEVSKENLIDKNNNSIDNPIIHILVIGFHHKKGCVIEYCYPELEKNPNDNTYILPCNWKHLPSLALPDGSHNYEQDCVYFHLLDTSSTTSNTNETQARLATIFGISCYRQINANELQTRDADITRTTVQKSVCILTRLPLYGYLKQKLNLITQAYFQQKNFQNTIILREAYNTLNNSLKLQINLQNLNYFVGLNLGDLVLKYEHKIVVLFKLLLLERKILFYLQPVNKLSNTIISLISLLPNQFDFDWNSNLVAGVNSCAGLYKSSNNLNLSYFSNIMNIDDNSFELNTTNDGDNSFIKVNYKKQDNNDDFDLAKLIHDDDNSVYFNQSKLDIKDKHSEHNKLDSSVEDTAAATATATQKQSQKVEPTTKPDTNTESASGGFLTPNEIKAKMTNVFKFNWLVNNSKTSEENTKKTIERLSSSSSFTNDDTKPTALSVDLLGLDFGMPFDIYTNGNVLHPYLSLHYLEYLNTSTAAARQNYNLKAYTIGATNFLFKQRLLNDLDVIIEEKQIDIRNEDLKKILQLTTADLRFADYIVKNVIEYKNNSKMRQTNEATNDNDADDVNTNWEGSDDWIRANFKLYLYSLLAVIIKNKSMIQKMNVNEATIRKSVSSILNDDTDNESENFDDDTFDEEFFELVDDFGINFVNTFLNTQCYKIWCEKNFNRLDKELEVNNLSKIAHPFNGQLNITDLKLKLMHTFSSTESGRKLNKAIVEGSKLMSNTSKAVVGGITQAKSSLSSFLSNITNKAGILNNK